MEPFSRGFALDTNVLLSLQPNANPVEELRLGFGSKAAIVIPKQVANELAALETKSKKLAKATRLARQMLLVFKISEKKVDAPNADDALLKMATEQWIVVTNDKALRERIKKESGVALALHHGKLKFEF